MRVLLVLLFVCVCISLAQSKRKQKTGPCTIDNCKVCNPAGKKCLTCESGYTNNRQKTVCFIPTAKIDPDWIEGNAIPAGGGGGDFDKDAFLSDIMEDIKALIAKAKEEAIAEAEKMDAAESGADVSGFLKQPEIEALIDNAVNAALEAASADSDNSGGGGAGAIAFDDTQCMRTPMGIEYVGKISETWNGKKCLPWKDVKGVGSASMGTYRNYDLDWFNFDSSWDEISNHCRTPLNVRPEVINRPPWCWTELPRYNPSETTDSSAVRQRWDYCNIPLCGNPQYRLNWLKTMKNPKYKSFVPFK